ncbi:MAG: MFS transporter, partial [Lachnospiraceae bacterium]|nr:MFS transporter [Lachnospiraceae bacterium]
QAACGGFDDHHHSRHKRQLEHHMENLTGGTPPVRYLPCVVPCKLYFPGFLIFAANGMLTVLTTVFLANTVDYGQWKNHRRDESVIFSMQTFVVKLASGVAALVASLCLNLCNLSSDTSDAVAAAGASGSSVVGLRMTMTLFPILLFVIGVIFFHKKYQLTEERLKEIQEA